MLILDSLLIWLPGFSVFTLFIRFLLDAMFFHERISNPSIENVEKILKYEDILHTITVKIISIGIISIFMGHMIWYYFYL
jgi:hypothetical protein